MRSGGSTTIDKDGKVIAQEAPTEDHPEGNKARPEPAPAPAGSADAPDGDAAGDGQEAAPMRRKRSKE